MDALSFYTSLDFAGLVAIFWFTVIFEVPRWMLGVLAKITAMLWIPPPPPLDPSVTLSILLVGHNEEKSLPICVKSLAEQTILARGHRLEIIVVNDGSTDRMVDVANALRRKGRVDRVIDIARRGGKSAGLNAGLAVCSGDIVIIADIDTTFDRDGLANLVKFFSDPTVGAVSGNIGVRNASASLMTRFQQIEYAIGLSLGRVTSDALGALAVISGAFGAFRRVALLEVGGLDVEVGEDADLTMKLRRAGWKIRFALRAHALTDVPESAPAFVAQRLRWDRGLITIWLRKYRNVIDPRFSTFTLSDAFVFFDIVFFQILLPVVFPIYVGWLIYNFGWFGVTILGATLVGYALMDIFNFIVALFVGIRMPVSRLIYLPLYVVLQVSLARIVRLIAIIQEFVFTSSHRDPYVPAHVMRQLEVR